MSFFNRFFIHIFNLIYAIHGCQNHALEIRTRHLDDLSNTLDHKTERSGSMLISWIRDGLKVNPGVYLNLDPAGSRSPLPRIIFELGVDTYLIGPDEGWAFVKVKGWSNLHWPRAGLGTSDGNGSG